MLLTSQNIQGNHVLVVGSTGLTKSRANKLLAQGATPIVVGQPESTGNIIEGVEYHAREFDPTDLTKLGRSEVDHVVDAVFVCYPTNRLSESVQISKHCRRLRIPVNVADQPDLCTFSLLSTHVDGDFHLGVSTSGKGCRLTNRIKRHVVNSLPNNIATICQKVGDLRQQIRHDDENNTQEDEELEEETGQLDEDAEQKSQFNRLVVEGSEESRKKQRLRWLSQIVEYYPLEKLAELDIDQLSHNYRQHKQTEKAEAASNNSTVANGAQGKKQGRISLVGAGPGSASLLTSAALQAINSADLILTDKLVPQPVLEMIPKTTPVQVAKKFPGNAEKAQQELLETGLEAVETGQHVVRLKQGDPYIFGRGAEEFVYFSERGYKPEVICGITSALSAPLLAKIPATHRKVADQVLFCTGTGKSGSMPNFPEYVESRTCVFLMALHRIDLIVDELSQKGWDLDVPCCVIERSSCPDQRIVRTRLKHVAEAVATLGSRPPGLLVTGFACEVITGDMGGEKWVVEEGL